MARIVGLTQGLQETKRPASQRQLVDPPVQLFGRTSETVSSITFEVPESMSEDKENRVRDPEEADEQADLTELELEIPTNSEWKIECKTYRSVLVPVWRNEWEDYHNEINQGPRGDVPARQLTDALGLVSQPQTYDLYESSGRRATIATDYKSEQDGVKRSQRFLFIRKDLLDEYLEEANLKLLFWIAGERQYSIEVFNRRADDMDGPFREEFSQVHVYEQG